MSNLTQILSAMERGEAQATEDLLLLVYDELRHLAAHRLGQESSGQSLQPTELVHEAYLRLVKEPQHNWAGRRQFFAAAAEAMRRILIERARRKGRLKHGRGWQRMNWETVELAVDVPSEELADLDEALIRLQQVDAMAAELMKLRFFAGLSHREAAEILGIHSRTADRAAAFARAWLYRELRGREK